MCTSWYLLTQNKQHRFPNEENSRTPSDLRQNNTHLSELWPWRIQSNVICRKWQWRQEHYNYQSKWLCLDLLEIKRLVLKAIANMTLSITQWLICFHVEMKSLPRIISFHLGSTFVPQIAAYVGGGG